MAAHRRRLKLSERKKYRTWTVGQKLEVVLAGLRGDRSVAEVCREHQISENLYYTWRGVRSCSRVALSGCRGRRSGPSSPRLRERVGELEGSLGRKRYELEILGNGFRTWE
jgi:transposase-like protein